MSAVGLFAEVGMLDWMINNSAWLTPVMVVAAVVTVLVIKLRQRSPNWKNPTPAEPVRAPISKPVPVPPPPMFERECEVVEVLGAEGKEATKVLACTLTRACMERFPMMGEAATRIMTKVAETGVSRVMIELASFGPASRGSFWVLRAMARDLSKLPRAGLLVVRFHAPAPGSPAWFADHTPEFYRAIPATTLEADAAHVAVLEPWQTPELDEL